MNQLHPVPFLGITGTNGKTSTLLMLKFILESAGVRPAVLDSWKGEQSFSRAAAHARAANAHCLLAEIPAEALYHRQISGSLFQAGGLTNVSLDHLSICHTPERYHKLKQLFFATLPDHAKAVFNADDPEALSFAQEGNQDFVSYALDYPYAMIMGTNVKKSGLGMEFTLSVNSDFISLTNQIVTPGSAQIRLPVTGRHNVTNALLASAFALLFNVDLEVIATSLGNFPGIRRNMEIIASNHYLIVDDSARNPVAISTALSALRQLNEGRILILHGLYGGGGTAMNRCNAVELARWLENNRESMLFVTRSMYHSKSRHQVRLSEEKAFFNALRDHGTDFAYFPDLPDAIESILSHASAGDAVLLLGGPVLNRAREIVLRAIGETSAGPMPAGLALADSFAHVQPIAGNPT